MTSRHLMPLLALLCLPTAGVTQEERFELGQRLKAMENAWEQANPDDKAKQRALAPLKRAVTSFFSARFGEAGRALDEARLALASEKEPGAGARWAAALALKPEKRVLDATVEKLNLELDSFYPPKVDAPRHASVRLTLIPANGGKPADKSHDVAIGTLPQTIELPLSPAVPGDYWLTIDVRAENEVLATTRRMISRIAKLSDSMEQLQRDAEKAAGPSTARATLRSQVEMLNQLVAGKPQETDYPAADMLNWSRQLANSLVAIPEVPSFKNQSGTWRMTFSDGQKRTPARVFAPEGIKGDRPLPLVIAMHGAGGTENLFFEGYGAGKVVQLCTKRGWLLVAPRVGAGLAMPALIDEVAKTWPVDRQRVFLVGHSMGAMQSIAAVMQSPDQFAGVAALGGGGAVRKADVFKRIPLFVGCGTEDFALGGARNLAKAAKVADGARVVMKEFPHIEHLVIVQVALPDVFAFFDEIAAK